MFLVVIGRGYYDGNGHNLWGYTIIIIYTHLIFLKIYAKKKVIAIFYENAVCLPFEETEREVLFEEIQEVKMTETLQLNLKEGEVIFLPKNEQNDDIYWGLKRILKEYK